MKNKCDKYINVVAYPNNECCGTDFHDHAYKFCNDKLKLVKPHVVCTQEVHVMRKDLFGSKVVDAILDSVENAIASSPDYIAETSDLDPIMQLFDEVMYDPYGYKRLISFNQFGSFYIAKVFDNDKFIFVAYSIYDIFDYYNSDSSKEIPYVKVYETLKDTEYIVTAVDNPTRYKCNSQMDEPWKYKITFENADVVDLFVNPSEICVSKVYNMITPINISDLVSGFVQFIVNHKVFEFHYSIKKKEITNTEYKDVWSEVQEKYNEELKALAPYGIESWTLKDTEEVIGVDELNLVPTINGPIVFVAKVIEEDPDKATDVDGDGDEDYDGWNSGDDTIISGDDEDKIVDTYEPSDNPTSENTNESEDTSDQETNGNDGDL